MVDLQEKLFIWILNVILADWRVSLLVISSLSIRVGESENVLDANVRLSELLGNERGLVGVSIYLKH